MGACCVRGGGEEKALLGVEVIIGCAGAEDMEDKLTRPDIFAPWTAETGFGAAK